MTIRYFVSNDNGNALFFNNFPDSGKSLVTKKTYVRFIVPCATATLVSQIGVLAVSTARRAPFAVIPNLLRHAADQGDSQTHSLGSADSSDAVHVIGLLVGQSYVYHWKKMSQDRCKARSLR